MEEKGSKRERVGEVVSNRMDKTVVVECRRRVANPVYKKIVVTRKKFKAHDEENKCKIGDLVKIVETRPLSKEKRWSLLEILERAK